jgi:hypothetical protein
MNYLDAMAHYQYHGSRVRRMIAFAGASPLYQVYRMPKPAHIEPLRLSPGIGIRAWVHQIGWYLDYPFASVRRLSPT